jgi:1,4-alpha-glucan branching enzyme
VVVPSLSEAFGLVNIEAMGVGVPVVASNTGGNAEIVRHGLDGFLFQPGNAHELSIYLEKICTDQTLATNMGHSARVRFLERFEQSEVVRVQSDWLEGLLNDLSNTR